MLRAAPALLQRSEERKMRGGLQLEDLKGGWDWEDETHTGGGEAELSGQKDKEEEKQ